MNSKNKGNLGEVKTLSKFIELNIPVYLPFGDNERADLIAEFDGKLNKIQVKSASMRPNGTCAFPFYSFSNAKGNNGKGYKKLFYGNEIDYFVLYNLTLDKIMIYKNNNLNQSGITIRYIKTRNNQSIGVVYFDEYSFEKLLK